MNNPITIDIESTIEDIMKIMVDKKIARVLVVENKKITSIITEKDLGLFLLRDDSDRTLRQIPIKELIKPIQTISQHNNIQDCANMMLEKKIGSLAIMSDEKNIVGIITKTDLVKDFVQNHPNEKIVGKYTSAHYSWVYSDVSLSKVVSKMFEDKVSRVIVRNEEKIPVGIITFRDLFSLVLSMGSQRDIIFPKSFEDFQGLGKTMHAYEIMRHEITTVHYNDDLAKACQLFLDCKINGAGVLSDSGELIGVVSKTDVLKAITTPNGVNN